MDGSQHLHQTSVATVTGQQSLCRWTQALGKQYSDRPPPSPPPSFRHHTSTTVMDTQSNHLYTPTPRAGLQKGHLIGSTLGSGWKGSLLWCLLLLLLRQNTCLQCPWVSLCQIHFSHSIGSAQYSGAQREPSAAFFFFYWQLGGRRTMIPWELPGIRWRRGWRGRRLTMPVLSHFYR